MKFPLALATLLATACLSAATALAGSLTLTGDTSTPGTPTFNRPTESGALSLQSAVPYNAYVFRVTASGAYNFTLVASNPDSYDTFLHLYAGGFNPAAPDAFFLAANDDGPGGAAAGSALSGVSLSAAQTYYLVADGFLDTDAGAYTATIIGPGNIAASPVPEGSSSLVLLGIALSGVTFVRRAVARRRSGAAALA